MNNLSMNYRTKSAKTDAIVEMIDFLTENGKCSSDASELEIKLLEMTLSHLKIRLQQIVSGLGRFHKFFSSSSRKCGTHQKKRTLKCSPFKVKSPTKGPQSEVYTKLLIYLTSKNIIQMDEFVQMNLADGLSSFTETLSSFKCSYLDLQVKNLISTDGFACIKEKVK